MIYIADDVKEILTRAIHQSSRKWIYEKEGHPIAIEKAREEFSLGLVYPFVEAIEIDPSMAAVLNIEHGMYSVWLLNDFATQRVFFDESTNKFGVAWGPDVKTGRYVDLGFRTDDPIDAFLA